MGISSWQTQLYFYLAFKKYVRYYINPSLHSAESADADSGP